MSPFKSKAQMRWGNSPAGNKALGAAGVQEWNAATRGKTLPSRITPAAAAKIRAKAKGKNAG